MRILIQRVSRAEVRVDNRVVGSIGRGYLLLVGIGREDRAEVLEPMARKVANLRLFPALDDGSGARQSHFDRSLLDEKAHLLVVSQFTLFGSCRKGRRPSFSQAAEPDVAQDLFDRFVRCLKNFSPRVETGEFGASMAVSLVNDGPVSIWLDSSEALPGARTKT